MSEDERQEMFNALNAAVGKNAWNITLMEKDGVYDSACSFKLEGLCDLDYADRLKREAYVDESLYPHFFTQEYLCWRLQEEEPYKAKPVTFSINSMAVSTQSITHFGTERWISQRVSFEGIGKGFAQLEKLLCSRLCLYNKLGEQPIEPKIVETYGNLFEDVAKYIIDIPSD